jgi:hypothetical protein
MPQDYSKVAEIIYAEHPDAKGALNNGAQLAIDTLKDSLPTEVTDQDLEVIFGLVAFMAADLLTTQGNDISAKLNVIFDTYTLAAGSCAGDIDLGDTSPARDLHAIMKEAQAAVQAHTDQGAVPGQYL